MGFCLVSNAVVAARHAQRAGRERILVIDWDVHHGNGTQALVEHDATIRYVSPRPEFTPPIIFSRDSRDRLVFMVEASPARAASLQPGLPVDVVPLGDGD